MAGFSQSINTAAVNVGGGNYTGNAIQAEWSIGEGASIETFVHPGGYLLTTGVLQPFTDKAPLLDFLNHSWLKDELLIYPVPVKTMLQAHISINASGPLSMELYNLQGQLLFTKNIQYLAAGFTQSFNVSGMLPGTYYLKLTLGGTPEYPLLRTGTFKIEKL
jgi:hypothetical protein